MEALLSKANRNANMEEKLGTIERKRKISQVDHA